MNHAQLERFDRFFDNHYLEFVNELTEFDPVEGVRRARSGFACAYRFWAKVEEDGDPSGWIHRDIHQQKPTPVRVEEHNRSARVHGLDIEDLPAERRRIVTLARRQRVVATAVIGASGLVLIAGELLIAHR